MAFVYWIHLKDHTDINTQGYVGMTSLKLQRRFDRHIHNAKNERGCCPMVERAIQRYGAQNIVFEGMFEGTTDECCAKEEMLRPEPYIGWNLWPGGNKGVLGFQQSKEVKDKCTRVKIGRPVSQETRNKISAALIGNKCAKGSVRTKDFKDKVSARTKGFRHTEESKARIGASSKQRKLEYWANIRREKVENAHRK